MQQFHAGKPGKRPTNQEAERVLYSADLSLTEASALMQKVGFAGDKRRSVKEAIGHAAKAVSAFLARPMLYGRAENIWRMEASPKAFEMDAIRAAALKAADRAAQEAKDEYRAITKRIERLEAVVQEALLVQDEEFMRPHADAERAMARRQNSPVD